jgi:hypothetical protein
MRAGTAILENLTMKNPAAGGRREEYEKLQYYPKQYYKNFFKSFKSFKSFMSFMSFMVNIKK